MAVADKCDRLQVAFDVVRQFCHHVPGDGKRAHRTERQRVTIGGRFGDDVYAYGERTARAVVDHDLLPHLLAERSGQHARDIIRGAAGSLRHHQAYRPVRVLCPRGKRQGQCEQAGQRQDKGRHQCVAAKHGTLLAQGVRVEGAQAPEDAAARGAATLRHGGIGSQALTASTVNPATYL